MTLVSIVEQNSFKPHLNSSKDLLERVHDVMFSICGDHEIVGQIATEQIHSGGKRLRARLAIEVCQLFDVHEHDTIHWAAAVEMLHNATLVHDDIQDGDTTRRGQKTAWAKHGIPQAINGGDLLLMTPALAIDRIRQSSVKADLQFALFKRAIATVRGQGADLRLREIVDESADSFDAYMNCIQGKTGELFALPVEGALLLAGYSRRHAAESAKPFFHLGVLFQLQDDILDLCGNKERGKPGNDIREGKISALVVEHLRMYPSERTKVLSILDTQRDETTDEDVSFLMQRFAEGGAKDAVLSRISSLCTMAHHEAPEKLKPLVHELITRVLAPIQHCY